MNRHRADDRGGDGRDDVGPHAPEQLGAHALGLLDPAQSRAVEEHLAACPICRREWEELRAMVDLLDDVPPEASLDGPPDSDLVLQRTLRRVRSESGAQRRTRRLALAGAAAVALTAVLGGGVLLGRTTAAPAAPATPDVVAAPAPADDALVLSGGGEPGVSMTATLTPAAGWVRLSAAVQGVPPGERCHIVVVAEDGSRHVAGGWLVPERGWRAGVTVDGSAIVALDQVEAVVVENEAGHEFATVRA